MIENKRIFSRYGYHDNYRGSFLVPIDENRVRATSEAFIFGNNWAFAHRN